MDALFPFSMIGNGILSSAFIRGTVHNMQNMILNMGNDFTNDKIFKFMHENYALPMLFLSEL